jgi:hypothetical protein
MAYSAELGLEVLIVISDIMGLDAAFKKRAELVYPTFLMLRAAKSGHMPSPDELSAEASKDLADLSKAARRLRRTFKGSEYVTKEFLGEPKGLEAIGLDRVKQATEELRRVKADFLLLIEQFDDKVRKSARLITIGRPETR